LDPSFLTAKSLNEALVKHLGQVHKYGLVPNKELVKFLKTDLEILAQPLLILFEKFQVGVSITNQEDRPFLERETLYLALIPEELEEKNWMNDHSTVTIEKILQFNNEIPPILHFQIYAQICGSMDEQFIWKKGMMLSKGKVKFQAQIQFDTKRIILTSRGLSRPECINMFALITTLFSTIKANFEGLNFDQMAQSPYSKECLIDLKVCYDEFRLPKEQRKLKCSKTRNMIDQEEMLINSGMIDKPDDTVTNWWVFKPDANWLMRGGVNTFCRLEVIENGRIKNQDFYAKLAGLVDSLDGVTHAYAIHNPLLTNGFDVCYKTIRTPKIEDWKELRDKDRRKEFLDHFDSFVKKYSWNHPDGIAVIPMIQGTSDEAAWSICENGFAIVATVDAGYFGKGIYLTSKLQYAEQYARFEENKGKAYILALVIPGNPYPVTEHPFQDEQGRSIAVKDGDGSTVRNVPNPDGFYGKGVMRGYHSHYTIVETGQKAAFPIKRPYDASKDANELVVFQNNQLLPIFVFYKK